VRKGSQGPKWPRFSWRNRTINSAKDGRKRVTTKRSVWILGIKRSESFDAGML
jgi:hypothetical protein